MIKIFVAGAYDGSNIIECLDNIKMGLKVCSYLLSKDFIPFCPWTDFLFHLVANEMNTPTLEQYRRYCLSLIEISDLVFVISGFCGINPATQKILYSHDGVRTEVRHAQKHGIPIYLYRDDLDDLVDLSTQITLPMIDNDTKAQLLLSLRI